MPEDKSKLPCKCCKETSPKQGVSDFCHACWTSVVEPAYRHVESLKPDDPHARMWFGWAIREAYIAGAATQKKKPNFNEIVQLISDHPEYPEPCPLLNEAAEKACEEMDKEWVIHMVREACRQTKNEILADLHILNDIPF